MQYILYTCNMCFSILIERRYRSECLSQPVQSKHECELRGWSQEEERERGGGGGRGREGSHGEPTG